MEELTLKQKLEIIDELITIISKKSSIKNTGICYSLTQLKCYDFKYTHDYHIIDRNKLKILFPELYELISKPPKENGYAFQNNKERLKALKDLRYTLSFKELSIEDKITLIDELVNIIYNNKPDEHTFIHNTGICGIIGDTNTFKRLHYDNIYTSVYDLKVIFPELFILITKDNDLVTLGYTFDNNNDRIIALRKLQLDIARTTNNSTKESLKELDVEAKLNIIDSLINYMNDTGLIYETHYITNIIKYIPSCKVLDRLSKSDFKILFPELYDVIDNTRLSSNDFPSNDFAFNTHTIIMLNNIKINLLGLKSKDKRLQPLSDEIKYIILNEIFNVFINNKQGLFPDYTNIIDGSSLYKSLKDKNLIELDSNGLIKEESFVEYYKLVESSRNLYNHYSKSLFDDNLRITLDIIRKKLSNKYIDDRAKS